MSDITQNFEINSIDLGVTVDTNQLTFTPDGISLNFYSGGISTIASGLDANIANVHIYGGTNGYVLQTDGTGNLSWTAQSGGGGNGAPGGSNTQVQYNDSGLFGGNLGFTFNEVTGNLNVPGNVIATNFIGNVSVANTALNVAGANVSGYVANATHANVADVANSVAGANISGQVSNSLIAGTVYTNSQPNITSLGTLSVLSVTGNISSGNANLGNLVIANFFSGNGSLLSGINGANVSNVLTANYANYAGNVVNATQSNITLLGTLTDLKISNSKIHLGLNAGNISQGNLAVAIGNSAGNISQGLTSVAIGNSAGNTSQGLGAVAIGNSAGKTSQGGVAVALGQGAGITNQGGYAIAIGSGAGSQNQGISSIAIGASAAQGFQGNGAIAIGEGAGYGLSNGQGICAIAIGNSAGRVQQGNHSIAIGHNAAGYTSGEPLTQPINSIIINATGNILNTSLANSFIVKPIRDVTGNASFTVTLKYNPTTGEIGYV